MINYYTQFKKIFTNDDVKRITLCSMQNCLSVEVDLHGMDCISAKRMLSNLTALMRSDFILSVIHGYNNGTALREMIRTAIINDRFGPYQQDQDNPGRTVFFVSPPAFLCAA